MKKTSLLLAIIMILTMLCGCNGKESTYKVGDLSYYSYDSNEKEVNKNLFYVNKSNEWGADPAIIYISEGEHAGYFYVYCTSGGIGTNGICAWRSKNLTDWEPMGPVFLPSADTNWGYKFFWAPSIIYDNGKYYMFYSAPWGSSGTCRYDSCAVSDSPEGPFMEITSDTKTEAEPLLIFERHKNEIAADLVSPAVGHDGTTGFIKAIGPTPFIDPQTGRRYLFFVADLGTENNDNTSGAYCLEMEDWATPKYETLTRITRYGKTTIDGTEEIREGGNTNEGPMCYYKDGKYYLLFLTYTYYSTNYQVRAAVADNVLGPYTKLPMDDGAQVMYTETNFQRQAVGIHGLTNVGDTLISTYMTFMNNVDYATGTRKFAIDEIVFTENSAGVPTMSCNGPSVTPQPLPEAISGYRNVTKDAKIASDNTLEGSDVKYLNDTVIPYHKNTLSEEYTAGSGTTNITLEFDDYKTLRAAMVYNSRDYDLMFNQIDSITFDYRKNGETGTVTIGPVKYNWDYYDKENNKPAVGSAAIAEFDELDVKKVTITLSTEKGQDKLAIPEIILLGKDSDGSSANAGEKTGALYQEYTFKNEVYDYDFRTDCDSKLAVDGELNKEYGDVSARLFLNNDTTSETYMDIYTYMGDDGLYVYADMNNCDMNYYDDVDYLENTYIDIGIGRANTGSVNGNTLEFKTNIAGEEYRCRGVKRSGEWLKGWFKGLSYMTIKNGTIDDLSKADGFTAEFFVPYTELGFEEGNVPPELRLYFGFMVNEDTGTIRRSVETIGKNMQVKDPSSWKKVQRK